MGIHNSNPKLKQGHQGSGFLYADSHSYDSHMSPDSPWAPESLHPQAPVPCCRASWRMLVALLLRQVPGRGSTEIIEIGPVGPTCNARGYIYIWGFHMNSSIGSEKFTGLDWTPDLPLALPHSRYCLTACATSQSTTSDCTTNCPHQAGKTRKWTHKPAAWTSAF